MVLFIDYTILQLVKTIQKKVKDKDGKELSQEVIIKIIESELDTIVNGMAQGHTINLKYFGSFVATKKRVDALNNTYLKRGKTPTLVDSGVMRMSFKKNGEKVSEVIAGGKEIEPKSTSVING